jgi:hypothetical protein
MKQTFTPSLKQTCSGLLLMTIFTACWIAIAEYKFQGKDYGIIGVLFLIIIIAFISQFIRFVSRARHTPVVNAAINKHAAHKYKKGFIIINTLQGTGIFLASVVLTNLHLPEYFVPTLAMIVGLHFFPLGYLFNRPFDYAAGTWTCLIALTGLLLIYNRFPQDQTAALVALGAAFAPAAYAVRMIYSGNKLIANRP